MLLVFGVAFEIPLFVVLLNLAGVLPGRALAKYRPWIIVGVFVFAAVATPSTDPFSMLMLAVPMTLLFFVSEIIARSVDRRRARARESFEGIGDDEVSPLGDVREDVHASGLGEEDD
jgi:sec-independent protein translocase protein TatC